MQPTDLYAAFMAEEALAAAQQILQSPSTKPWATLPGPVGLKLWRVSATRVTVGIQHITQEGYSHLLPIGLFDAGGVVPGFSRVLFDEFAALDAPIRCKRLSDTFNALLGAGSLATRQLATQLHARVPDSPVAHLANGHPLVLECQPFGRVVCLLAYPPLEGEPLPVLEGEPLCTYGFTKMGGWELEPEPQHKTLFETLKASGLLSCYPVVVED